MHVASYLWRGSRGVVGDTATAPEGHRELPFVQGGRQRNSNVAVPWRGLTLGLVAFAFGDSAGSSDHILEPGDRELELRVLASGRRRLGDALSFRGDIFTDLCATAESLGLGGFTFWTCCTHATQASNASPSRAKSAHNGAIESGTSLFRA